MSRDFDGVNDFLSVESSPVTAAPFTVSTYFQPKVLNPTNAIVWIGDPVGGDHWIMHVLSSGELQWRSEDVPTGRLVNTTTVVTEDVWQHGCAVEASSTDRRVFLDGGGKGTNTELSVPTGATRVGIGARTQATPDSFFEGEIGHLAIWNVALSDDEVLALSNGVYARRMRPDNLVYYCPCNGQDPEPDIIGGLDMAITGAPNTRQEPPIAQSVVAPG